MRRFPSAQILSKEARALSTCWSIPPLGNRVIQRQPITGYTSHQQPITGYTAHQQPITGYTAHQQPITGTSYAISLYSIWSLTAHCRCLDLTSYAMSLIQHPFPDSPLQVPCSYLVHNLFIQHLFPDSPSQVLVLFLLRHLDFVPLLLVCLIASDRVGSPGRRFTLRPDDSRFNWVYWFVILKWIPWLTQCWTPYSKNLK